MRKKTKLFIKKLFYRHQKPISTMWGFKSGLKSVITMTILSAIGYLSSSPLIMASFGASCILIYMTPENKYAQPINVLGGYFIATTIGLAMNMFFPHDWWVVGIMLGITIFLMAMFRVTHPPAGAVPLIILFNDYNLGWNFLLNSMIGCVFLVALSILMHRIPPAREYPKKLPE